MKLFISILFFIPSTLFAEPEYLCNKIKGQVYEISRDVEVKDFGVDTFVIDINENELIFKPDLGGFNQISVKYEITFNDDYVWQGTLKNKYDVFPYGETTLLYDKNSNIFQFNFINIKSNFVVIASCRNI